MGKNKDSSPGHPAVASACFRGRSRSQLESEAVFDEHLEIHSRQFAVRLRDEVEDFDIEFQPESDSAISDELCKVLSAVERSDAKSTLDDLRDLNNQFVGESSVRVLAKLELSGELLAISELTWDWIHRYARRRLEKFNGRDDDLPLEKFERLTEEGDRLVLERYFRPGTIGRLMNQSLTNRLSWFLYVPLLDKYTGFRGKRSKDGIPRPEIAAAVQADWHKLDRPKFHEVIQAVFKYLKWQLDYLPRFFHRIGNELTACLPTESDCLSSKESAIAELKGLANDVMEMRRFLCGSKPGEISLNIGKAIVGLKWITLNGMIELHVGGTHEELMQSIHDSADRFPKVLLRYDGQIADCFRLDITSFNHAEATDDWVRVNLALLRQVFDQLYLSYEKVDFDRLRNVARSGTISPAEERQVLAVVLADLEFRDEADSVDDYYVDATVAGNEAESRRHQKLLRPIRHSTLAPVLARFGCDMRQGKGSEVKVFRPGSTYSFFTLSKHGQNPLVDATLLRKLLRHFNIGIGEFTSTAYS